ncbi:MAG: DUF938 domain-containing protein [Acetobacteraceae bacterium]
MSVPDDARRHAPATLRNRDPILAVLRRVLPEAGIVLEVASGTGEHVVHFANALPDLVFQPTDLDASARDSIDAWVASTGLRNVRGAVALDTTASHWPVAQVDAVLCSNMIHIAPWDATVGLIAGAARVLTPGGILFLYGPFRRNGDHTGPGNAAFDAMLRSQDPEWGLRDLEAVADLASAHGFADPDIVAMPADNLSVIFRHR